MGKWPPLKIETREIEGGCFTHQTMGQNSMKMKILNFFSELWGKLPERFTESFLEFTFCYLELTLIINKLPFLDRDLTKMWNNPFYLLIIIFLVTYCHSFYCPYQHRHLGRNIFQLHGPSGAVFKRIFILDLIEYQILFVLWNIFE